MLLWAFFSDKSCFHRNCTQHSSNVSNINITEKSHSSKYNNSLRGKKTDKQTWIISGYTGNIKIINCKMCKNAESSILECSAAVSLLCLYIWKKLSALVRFSWRSYSHHKMLFSYGTFKLPNNIIPPRTILMVKNSNHFQSHF